MDRLSPLDVSFLHIEDADRTAHMHVASIGIFEGPPPPQAEIAEVFAERLPMVPRYRQRVQDVPFTLARPVWVDDTDFDLDYHVRRTALPAPGGEKELRDLVGRIASQRLDRTKPLWETWIVEGLAEDQWAIIGKTHHCMIDGVSGAELMAALLDLTPEVVRHPTTAWTPTPVTSAGLASDAVRSLATDIGEQVRAVRAAVRRPTAVAREVGEIAGGVRSLSTIVRPAPAGGELTGPIGSHRVFAWADASLADVKEVRTALGGTVNDVVLASLTNGYRAWLDGRGETVESDRVVRTLVPVSVRATRDDGAATGDGTMANKVSAMFASLPVGLDDPTERLHAITAELTGLKESKQALAGEALTSLGGFAPAALLALGSRVAFRSMATWCEPGRHRHHQRARSADPAVRRRAAHGAGVPVRPDRRADAHRCEHLLLRRSAHDRRHRRP